MLVSTALVALVGLVAVGLLAAMFAGSRSSLAAVLGLLAVACLGAVGWFVFRPAVPVVPAPSTPPAAVTARPGAASEIERDAPSGVPSPAVAETRSLAGRVILGALPKAADAASSTGDPDDEPVDEDGELTVSVNVSMGSGASTSVTGHGPAAAGGAVKGEPAAGAMVEVYPGDVDLVTPGEPLLSVVTDGEGRFQADGVPSSPVRLRARREALRSAFVTHAPGAADATLVLFATGTVTGVVKDAAAKVPVKGARVEAGDGATALTDGEGRYRIEGAPRTSRDWTSVRATATGYVAETRPARLDAEGAAAVDFDLDPATTLSGTVFAVDGKPAAGASVVLETAREVPFAGSVHAQAGTVTSDGAGRYVFDAAPVGQKLRLTASTERALSAPVEEPPLSVGSPRDGVDLRLEPAAVLVVTVSHGKGSPVAGARVSALPDDGEEDGSPRARGMAALMAARGGGPGTATDDKGVARIGPLRPGRLKVTAAISDFRPGEATATAAADAETAVSISLEAGQSVSGRVVDDQGAPVEGAAVTAQRFGMGGGGFFSETRTSDAEGRFRIGGMDGRPVNMNAQKSGHVRTSLNNIKPGTADLEVSLPRGGVIKGVAKGPDGAPLAEFRVSAERTDQKKSRNPMDFGDMAGLMGGNQVKDASGAFRVDGLAAGVYKVEVKSAGVAPGRVHDVQVVAAEETEVEVTCPEGLTLRGVVVAKSDGRLLAGASVSIRDGGMFGGMDVDFDMGEDSGLSDDESRQATEAIQAMSGGAAASVTGPDGAFVLKGLEEGKVSIRATAKEFAPQTVKNVQVPAAAELRIELAEGGVVTGRVTDVAGQPLKDQMVMLQKLPMVMRMTRTAADGTYRVGGLVTGTYLFYVMDNPMGMMGGGGGLNLKSESIRVEEGKTVVKDHRKGEGIKVTGRVTRAGKPVASTMVMLMPGSDNSSNPMAAMLGGGGGAGGFAMGSTDADGKYEITGVNPGRYTLTVQSGMGGGTAGSEPVEVPKGSTVVTRDVVLPVNLVRGIVLSAAGEPVSGAQVLVTVPGTDLTKFADLGEIMQAMGGQGFTDDEGRFTVDDLKPGTYSVRASAKGYGTVQVENVVASADPAEVRVVLEGNHPLNVRVVAADGSAMQGASVYVVGGNGADFSQMDGFDLVRTDADGRVEIHAPAGPVTVEAVASGHGPGSATASVPSSGEVVIRLPAAAALEVVVTGPGGPVAAAAVALLDGEGNPYRQRFSFDSLGDMLGGMQTDGQGRFVKRDLPAGAYRVRVTMDGRTGEAAASVLAGETRRVEITLK